MFRIIRCASGYESIHGDAGGVPGPSGLGRVGGVFVLVFADHSHLVHKVALQRVGIVLCSKFRDSQCLSIS